MPLTSIKSLGSFIWSCLPTPEIRIRESERHPRKRGADRRLLGNSQNLERAVRTDQRIRTPFAFYLCLFPDIGRNCGREVAPKRIIGNEAISPKCALRFSLERFDQVVG